MIVRRQRMLEEFGRKRVSKRLKEKAFRIAQGEVQTYDQYLRGEVYGYIIDEDGTLAGDFLEWKIVLKRPIQPLMHWKL